MRRTVVLYPGPRDAQVRRVRADRAPGTVALHVDRHLAAEAVTAGRVDVYV